MADPDTVSAQLLAAGFTRPSFERHDHDIRIGRDVDEAVAVAMEIGPAGELLRLAGPDGERHRPAVLAALHELTSRRAGPEGVVTPSSTWLISALAP
ncbi:MAG TPA: hypothetical protein VK698_20180 [Kofleriaceae bacterium]|nr:hypothetical protein [Kofleriaceae bacterium]